MHIEISTVLVDFECLLVFAPLPERVDISPFIPLLFHVAPVALDCLCMNGLL